VPLDVVIEFKRDVYQRALQELSRFVTWPARGQHGERRHSARYLRQPHGRSQAAKPAQDMVAANGPGPTGPESLVLSPNK
jgi:putative (di)nucleoside polyphosphate hydrolase